MLRTYTGCFFERFDLVEAQSALDLVFEKDSSGSILIFAGEPVERLDLHMDLQQGCTVRVFLANNAGSSLVLASDAGLMHDARLQYGILDLNSHPFDCEVLGNLIEEGADMEVFTAIMALEGQDKRGHLKITHSAPHTYGNMHNFGVVFDKGSYDMVADGTIRDKCPGSESHQETRVLTMGEGHKVRCLPLLYIDENDVKASHALTVGQPDESQMFYLESRGLDRNQAVGLLSIGYFMPVIDLISDEKLHEELREEMERRVVLYGH